MSPSLAEVERLVRGAAKDGADLIMLTEMVEMLEPNAGLVLKKALSEDQDPGLAKLRDLARETGKWIMAGSLLIKESGSDKVANRAFMLDPKGGIVARYDKIHLFDVDLPTGESWRESNVYKHGSEAVVVSGTPVGTLGLTICYDLRFPALFARLAEAGSDLIAVPAAFTVPTGRAHWEVLLRARAIEAGLFVVAAAQSGHHEDGRNTYGHSLVVDPWGEVLLDMADGSGVGFAEIELSRITDVRGRVPALSHRRAVGEAVAR